ncbi:hypothetical protein B0A55_03493, partial [Friedmanniomyces simplex]
DMVGMGMGPQLSGGAVPSTVHPPLHLPAVAGGAVGGGAGGVPVVDQDEPSDFEWRNLKKLTVLVLSSLVWKNKKVQDQVREYGGLEALVSCCRPEGEESNPYIREHAIMCLRFAVEGNEANVGAMRGLVGHEREDTGSGEGMGRRGRDERGLLGGMVTLPSSNEDVGREGVVREVLDQGGYETFLDGKGQVGLRRKVEGGQQAYGPGPSSAVQGQSHNNNTTTAAEKTGYTLPNSNNAGISKPAPPRLSPAKVTAERAAELMQNALRDLPLGDKLVTDKQKAEALAKLDRAFESTERALGRGNASNNTNGHNGGAGGKKGGGA